MGTHNEEMESPLKWIRLLEPNVQSSAKSKGESMEDYVQRILKVHEEVESAKEVDDNDSGNNWRHKLDHTAGILNTAAMYTFIGDLTSAASCLDNLHDNVLTEMRNVDDIQYQVIQFCRDILLCTREIFSETNWDWGELNDRWEGIKEEGKSMIAFIKGMLAKQLLVDDVTIIQFFIEASQAPPNLRSVMYHHHAYRLIRRVRKDVGRRLIGLTAACLEVSPEAELAKVQYQLFPNDMIATLDFALMNQETRNPDRAMDVVALFEQALDLAKQEMNDLWATKIKIYMAEFLVFERGDTLDHAKGEELYQECEQENVKKTSFVFHKLAKFYKRFHKDRRRAEEYCKLGLEKDQRNFCCLMDYLKLLRGRVHEMLELIDKTLKNYPLGEDIVVRLHAIRGCVIWAYQADGCCKPEEAVESWIFALKTFPSYERHVYDSIKDEHLSRLFAETHREGEPTFSAVPVTVEAVVGYLKRKIWSYKEDRKLVRSFIENLEKLEKFRYRVGKGKFECRADKDNNWRS